MSAQLDDRDNEMSALEEQLALALSRIESAEASAAARLAELEAQIAAAEARAEASGAQDVDLATLEAELAAALSARLAAEAERGERPVGGRRTRRSPGAGQPGTRHRRQPPLRKMNGRWRF
jgi:recombinational DNA repair ATPase RecF